MPVIAWLRLVPAMLDVVVSVRVTVQVPANSEESSQYSDAVIENEKFTVGV